MSDKIYKSKVKHHLIDAAVKYYQDKGESFYLTFEDDVLYHNTPEQEKTPVSSSDLKAIDTIHKQMIADNDALQYARNREDNYPSIEEQLDMQYHDAVNGTTTWKDTIAKVKADNPKE